jgi:hypothetical protein
MISLVLIGMHFDRVAVNDKNEKTTTTTQNRSERQQSTRKFQEEDESRFSFSDCIEKCLLYTPIMESNSVRMK